MRYRAVLSVHQQIHLLQITTKLHWVRCKIKII